MLLSIEDLYWLAITVYHEARGESEEGQKNVVKVILNRADRRHWPISNVVLARKQFSCFNNGLKDPSLWIKNIEVLGKVFTTCKEGFDEWVSGNNLKGATHYYAIKGMVDNEPPYWASSMTFICEVGGHRFFREDK